VTVAAVLVAYAACVGTYATPGGAAVAGLGLILAGTVLARTALTPGPPCPVSLPGSARRARQQRTGTR
jgi:hypothetical protein